MNEKFFIDNSANKNPKEKKRKENLIHRCFQFDNDNNIMMMLLLLRKKNSSIQHFILMTMMMIIIN